MMCYNIDLIEKYLKTLFTIVLRGSFLILCHMLVSSNCDNINFKQIYNDVLQCMVAKLNAYKSKKYQNSGFYFKILFI